MNQETSGFTIIETMIALSLAGIVGSALLLMVVNLQKDVREMSLACERNENLRIVPLILSQTLQAAGCGVSYQRLGLELLGEQISVRSDIDGPKGFPDRTLNQSYENLELRLNGSTLQLQSGEGSFQPLVLYVKKLTFDYRNQTDLKLEIEGEKRSIFNNEASNRYKLRFFLWNYRRNLFEKGPAL